MASLRDELRALPSVTGRAPRFDLDDAPAAPGPLLIDWLRIAVDAGVQEPHAATLSTVDADGAPDARVLLVKDVTGDGDVAVATGDDSAKGRQLAARPDCALSLHWPALARAVRIRGVARRADAAVSAADFLARPAESRAVALAGHQSDPMPPLEEQEAALAAARAELRAHPGLVAPLWTVWLVAPRSVEFWQGSPDRDHLRLRYDRAPDGWARGRLRP